MKIIQRMTTLMMITGMLISMNACGGTPEEESQSVAEAPAQNVQEENSSNTSVKRNHNGRPYLIEPMSNYDFDSFHAEYFKFNHDFSRGYLFVKLTDIETRQKYIGCMDNHGEITYAMAFEENYQYHYYGTQDGMLQIRDTKGGFWISCDQNGNVIGSYQSNPSATSENPIVSEIVAGGDRYIAVKETKSDFSGVTDVLYGIIDNTGEVVQAFNDVHFARYDGEGIFESGVDNGSELRFFNAQTKTIIGSRQIINYWGNSDDSEVFLNGNDGRMLTDGTVVNLSEAFSGYDSDLCEIVGQVDSSGRKHMGRDAVENHYTIFKDNFSNGNYHLYLWDTHQVLDCFPGITTRNAIEFQSDSGMIACTAKGGDTSVYYMILDCKGNTLKELTQIPDSYGSSEAMMFFIDGKAVISYNNFTAAYVYDTNSGQEQTYDLTKDSLTVHTSNFHDGWAECECLIPNVGSLSNYVNQDNQLLFEFGGELGNEYVSYATSGIYFMDDSKILS